MSHQTQRLTQPIDGESCFDPQHRRARRRLCIVFIDFEPERDAVAECQAQPPVGLASRLLLARQVLAGQQPPVEEVHRADAAVLQRLLQLQRIVHDSARLVRATRRRDDVPQSLAVGDDGNRVALVTPVLPTVAVAVEI